MIPADPIPQITPPVEDYLKAIYSVAHEGNAERVSTSEIAERMDVSAASATNMMQKLAEMRLADYVPYKGVALTSAGEKIALEVIRHHRLIELYLAEALGYSWDTVHDEAERLEHVISEEFEDRIDAMLGHPTTDPHGDPIPPRSGGLPTETLRLLSDVAVGESVVVQRVSDRDGAVLRRLSSLGIHPGVHVRVIDHAPRGGPVTLDLDETPVSIDEALARRVYVA
ncbi:MAG: metal-dependent transcriptional regulator [Gemmatimonadetes bacterium]|nr:metal-dependent transcriptional regulator [Gemmatimonadota bacterium]